MTAEGCAALKAAEERRMIQVDNFKDSLWAEEYRKFAEDRVYAGGKTIREISGLVSRVIGEEWTESFVFTLTENKGADGRDFYELSSRDGKILISGPNGVSLAAGFHYYLKNYAYVNYNPILASHVKMPESLPEVAGKIVRRTPYCVRYALNYCTYAYTMAFWGWKEYEALLDWLAMNGVNLMLDIVGQEEVQRRFVQYYGFSDEEIKAYLPGPGYLPWFYMQNMTAFGGPLPDVWFAERVELARKMHERMQAYGILPVLQGYSGMVPNDFAKKRPDAEVIPQGKWCGFVRPGMLRSCGAAGRDFFGESADLFYRVQEEVFGRITNYYSADPFHEGGNVGGQDPAGVYRRIQEKMLEHDPGAVWLLQQWQGQVTAEKLSGLAEPAKALVLDLQADRKYFHEIMEQQNVPWVWCMIYNFGGRMGVDGDLEKLAYEIPEKLRSCRHMKGIGIAPEAIANTPVMYDLIFDMAWTDSPVDYVAYTERYIASRYGKRDERLWEAWKILLKTALARKERYAQGAPESVINARPAEDFVSASAWGHGEPEYSPEEFEKALPLFLSAYEDFQDCETYLFDLTDVAGQVLSNSAFACHRRMMKAYRAGAEEEFRQLSGLFLDMIRLLDQVLGCCPYFDAGRWFASAAEMLPQMDDSTRKLFVFNARALIATWGGLQNVEAGLLDYSNRRWAGVIGEYCLPRWEAFVAAYAESLAKNEKPRPVDYFKMEWDWVNRPVEPGLKDGAEKGRPAGGPGKLLHEVWESCSLKALRAGGLRL